VCHSLFFTTTEEPRHVITKKEPSNCFFVATPVRVFNKVDQGIGIHGDESREPFAAAFFTSAKVKGIFGYNFGTTEGEKEQGF
jgi:hypothetical protein